MEDLYEDEDYCDGSEIGSDERASSPLQPPTLEDLLPDGPDFSPTQQDLSKGEEILDILSNALLGDSTSQVISPSLPSLRLRYSTIDMVTLGIIPLGFYAWGLWKPNDTISVCVAGTPSAETFFDLARTRLSAHKDLITIEAFNILGASFDLLISSVKVELVYHSNPFISQWRDINEDNLDEIRAKLPRGSTERFDDLTKTHNTEREISDYGIGVVAKAYWTYLTWSKNLGLYPILLGKERTLCFAVYGLSKEVDPSDFSNLNLPVTINEGALNSVANRLELEKTRFKLRDLQSIAIVAGQPSGVHGHFLPAIKTIRDFSIPQWPIFFVIWRQYIRVSVSFWGSSSIDAAGWFSTIEKAIKECQPNFPSNKTRYQFWPYPFEERTDRPWMGKENEAETLAQQIPDEIPLIAAKIVKDAPYLESGMSQTEFELSYFIGGNGPTGSLNVNSAGVRNDLSKGLEDALKNRDKTQGSYCIDYLERNEIKPVWYPYVLKHVPNPADLRALGGGDEDDDDEEEYSGPPSPEIKKPKPKPKSKAKSKAQRKRKRDVPEPALAEGHKTVFLRPAADVLNRLRHDEDFNIDDYLIGYLDRFKGIKEVPARTWTKEHTSQEFIPQSRIRYFKRKSDRVVVWDRSARVDLIFEDDEGYDTRPRWVSPFRIAQQEQ